MLRLRCIFVLKTDFMHVFNYLTQCLTIGMLSNFYLLVIFTKVAFPFSIEHFYASMCILICTWQLLQPVRFQLRSSRHTIAHALVMKHTKCNKSSLKDGTTPKPKRSDQSTCNTYTCVCIYNLFFS